jgi:hypothetical protein
MTASATITTVTASTDTTRRRRPVRTRPLLAVLVALMVAVGAVAAVRLSREHDPVDDALARLSEESRFDSSTEAVQSFALVYQDLVDGLPEDCSAATGRGRCLGLHQAAAWSLAFSTASGSCTQPAIQEGRIALRGYVRTADDLGRGATEAPPLPAIPSC